MILAKLTESSQYMGICPLLDEALRHMTPAFLAGVGEQTIHLQGDALYATRFTYETVSPEESVFEAHRRYLDIHIMMEGEERIDLAHPDALTPAGESIGDFYPYAGWPEQSVLLSPGSFLVVFPGDAHRLKLHTGERKTVSKVVFKILFEQEQVGAGA